jgi:hypothetical protein
MIRNFIMLLMDYWLICRACCPHTSPTAYKIMIRYFIMLLTDYWLIAMHVAHILHLRRTRS